MIIGVELIYDGVCINFNYFILSVKLSLKYSIF